MTDYLNDLLERVRGRAKIVGNEDILLSAIYDMDEKYKGQNLKDPVIKLNYVSDVLNQYFMHCLGQVEILNERMQF